MARMLGTCQRDWCPRCRTAPGVDCPSTARSKGQARAGEKRVWRKESITWQT